MGFEEDLMIQIDVADTGRIASTIASKARSLISAPFRRNANSSSDLICRTRSIKSVAGANRAPGNEASNAA